MIDPRSITCCISFYRISKSSRFSLFIRKKFQLSGTWSDRFYYFKTHFSARLIQLGLKNRSGKIPNALSFRYLRILVELEGQKIIRKSGCSGFSFRFSFNWLGMACSSRRQHAAAAVSGLTVLFTRFVKKRNERDRDRKPKPAESKSRAGKTRS